METDLLEKLCEHEARYFTFAGALTKTPGAWFLDGPDLPDYRDANHALHLRDDGRGAHRVASDVIAHYQARGLRVVADVDALAEAQGIGAVLRQRGVLPALGDTLAMSYLPATPPEVSRPEIIVQTLANETGAGEAQAWVETVMSDFEAPHDPDARMWRAVTEREARSPDCRLYLAYLDGQPAGACDVFHALGWHRVESVVTRPEFRRRGVASALVARAVADALRMGGERTYLYTEAGGAGEQVYRRLGFSLWERNPLRRHMGRPV